MYYSEPALGLKVLTANITIDTLSFYLAAAEGEIIFVGLGIFLTGENSRKKICLTVVN